MWVFSKIVIYAFKKALMTSYETLLVLARLIYLLTFWSVLTLFK